MSAGHGQVCLKLCLLGTSFLLVCGVLRSGYTCDSQCRERRCFYDDTLFYSYTLDMDDCGGCQFGWVQSLPSLRLCGLFECLGSTNAITCRFDEGWLRQRCQMRPVGLLPHAA
jgi:hypothetical protein